MRPPYYLTPYGIARKHGFEGTEEEWLNSLTAFYLAQKAGYEGTIDEWLGTLNDPIPNFTIGKVETLPGGSLATVTISGTKENPVLNFGIPEGIGMSNALALVGGIMQGDIDMDDNAITNLHDPKREKDAVHKGYADKIKETADAALPQKGGKMLGPVDMNGQTLSGLNEPTDDDEAANKGYVDTVAKTKTVYATLSASGWTGDAAPYTQTITVSELTEGVKARVFPAFPGDATADLALMEACAAVSNAKRVNGTITFTCLEDKPAADIPVNVELYHGAAITAGEDVPLLGFGGGGLKMELLWENASPTSEFAAQTISLDLSAFTEVAVDFAITTDYGNSNRVFAPIGGNGGFFIGVRPFSSAAAQFTIRNFSASLTGVSFVTAYKMQMSVNGRTEDNTYGIPIRIYGIKGVSA